MPTAKKTAPAKTVAATKPAAAPAKKAAVAKAATPAAGAPMKPIKEALNKTAMVAHLAQASGVDAKAVKAVMTAYEQTVLASINKKGAGEFTMPGLFKVSVVNVPAKKKRVGIDPFTKAERTFAAKPATVKVKVRALKKLKDGAA